MSRFKRSRVNDVVIDENFIRLERYFLYFHEDRAFVQGSGASESIADDTTYVSYNPGTTGSTLSIAGWEKRGDPFQTVLIFRWGFTFSIDVAAGPYKTRVRSVHADGTAYTTTETLWTVNVINDRKFWGFCQRSPNGYTSTGMKAGTYTITVQWAAQAVAVRNSITTDQDYGWLDVVEVPMDKSNASNF